MNLIRCYDTENQKIVISRYVALSNQSTNNDGMEVMLHHNEKGDITTDIPTEDKPESEPRRSSRINKGVPPEHYGYTNASSKYMNWYEKLNSNEENNEQINFITEPKTYNDVLKDEN